MEFERTPYVRYPPRALTRSEKPPRTPVINGLLARPLTELVQYPDYKDSEIEVSLKLNELCPHDEPLWEQSLDYLCKASLAYFFAEMISGPPELPYNGRSLVGKHHEDWDRVIQGHERVQLEAARDHGKSHFFSLAYVIWKAGYVEPGSLGYLFSSTQDTADALLAIIKNELLTNPKFKHLIPVTGDRLWSKKELRLRNGSIIRARGMGVKTRGAHPSYIVCDDCLTDEDIYSETIRKRTIDYYLSAIVNMIKPGGQIIVVGTPMHYGDLYGYLRETGEYFCKKYPAIDKTGKILFPERYDRKRLEARKRELGPSRFAREFLCQPLSDESSLFPTVLFQGGDVRLPYVLGLPAAYWEKRGMIRYTGVDFAMSASAGADYTVVFTVAVDPQGVRWIVDIVRKKGLGFQVQLDLVKETYARYLPDVIHAEANQMQRIFTDEIIRETDIPIRKFFTSGTQPKQPWRKGMTQLTMGKHHIDRGVPSMRMSLENKKWRIPRGNAESIETTDVWIGEMSSMGWINGQVNSVGDHDDTVMACWMCDSAVRMGGFRFSFGDEEQLSLPQHDIEMPGQKTPDREIVAVKEMNGYVPNEPDNFDVPENDSSIEGAPRATDLGFGVDTFGFG